MMSMTKNNNNNNQAPALKGLVNLSSYLLTHDPDFHVSKFQVFLLIAQKEGIAQREIVQRTGLTQPTVSRIIARLANAPDKGRGGGLHWVEANPDPMEPRRYILSLTPKGHKVLADVSDFVG